MIAFIMLFNILVTQTGIQVTKGGITQKILQKGFITKEEMTALENTEGGIFMGISSDSNYIYLSEKPFKVDKRNFNFRNLPQTGDYLYIKLEESGKEKVAIYCSTDFDDAVSYKKGLLK